MISIHTRWIAFVILILLAPATLSQQGDTRLSPYQQSWLKEHPIITVGVHGNDWPPFEMVDQGEGGHSGLSFAYLDAITAHLGVTYTTSKYASREALIEAACRGEVDLVLGIVFTTDNTKCFIFTDSYFNSPTVVVGRKKESRADPSQRLAGLRVVTEAGYAEQAAAKTRYPHAIHLAAPDTVTALKMVRDGKADLYLGNPYTFVALTQAQDIEGLEILRQSEIDVGALHFATPDSRRALAQAIDIAILQMTPAQHLAIQDEWLPPLAWVEKGTFTLSAAEQHALEKPLRLLVVSGMAPISLVDEAGVPDGLAAEYLRRFEAIGAQFTVSTADNWNEARVRMRAGEVDAVLSIPVPDQDDPHWVYSLPYLTVPNVIVEASNARRVLDIADLNRKRIALSDPLRLGGPLLAKAPQASIVPVASTREGLKALDQRSANAYIGNLALVDQLIRDKYVGRLQVAAPTPFEDRIAFAFSREHAAVAPIFNRMLVSIPLRERQAIRGDWLATDYGNQLQWGPILKWAIPVLLLVIAVGIALHLSNMRLRREIAQRHEMEMRLERVTSNLPAVVYKLERAADGTLALPYIAGDMQALFGLSAEAAMDSMAEVIARIHPEDVALFRSEIDVSAHAMSSLDVEFRSHPDLGLHWIQAKGRPRADDDGKVFWSGYLIDVTQAHVQSQDLRAAKTAAEAAVVAKAEFLATMSHEIRTPMSGILGFLEMLEQTDPDVEQRHILQVIGESAHVLSQILDDILDYSKIEAGAMELDPTPVDMRQAMESVQRMLATQTAEKGLRVWVHADPGLSQRHYVDGVRLKQILFNLLSNAIKFTSHGEVTLRLWLSERADGLETVLLSVKDTGIGISEDQEERLFQPFSQAESSITRRYGGTGLGLSICRRLVELMDGSLWLESTPDVGTTVTVELTLPVAPPSANTDAGQIADTAQIRSQGQYAWTGQKVLVAEDHPTNQILMRWRLDQLGLDCDIAANGQLALDALATGHYDLLITDCQMPVMDGFELTREIRRREATQESPRLPIIAMTASVLDDDVANCMRADMDDFLAKPVPLIELKNTLERWLGASGKRAVKIQAVPDKPLESANWGPSLPAMKQTYGSMEVAISILESLSSATYQDLARAVQAQRAVDQEAMLQVLHRIVGSLGVLTDSPASLHIRDLMSHIESEGLAASNTKIDKDFERVRSLLATLGNMVQLFRVGERES